MVHDTASLPYSSNIRMRASWLLPFVFARASLSNSKTPFARWAEAEGEL